MPNRPRTFSRREALALGAGGLACASWPAGLAAGTEARTLRDLARARGIMLGASFAAHELDAPYGASYGDLYKRQVESITTELELKMAILRPTADVIEFGPTDRVLAFAAANALKVRAHTLIWNDYLPDWILRLTPKEAGHLLEAHIETVMTRYSGRFETWDVVNEPIAPWHHLPGRLRNGAYYAAFGAGYIAKSFQLARSFDATAKLALNEAQTESADENGAQFRESLLALVRQLKDDGVPLDVIGLQCHLDSRKPYDFPRFAAFVEDIAAMGLEIHVTELDVNDWAFPTNIKRRDEAVAELYSRFLKAILPIRAVTEINFWQLADHTSWLVEWNKNEAAKSGKIARAPRPLPYDADFNAKPAWHAIAKALETAPRG